MNKSNFIGFLIIGFLITILLSRTKSVNLDSKQVENSVSVVNNDVKGTVEKTQNNNEVENKNIDENRNIVEKVRSERKKIITYVDNEEIFLENDDIKVYFSKMGGRIRNVILKNYKDFAGENVELLCESNVINFELKDYNLNTAELYFDDYKIDDQCVEFNFKDGDKEILIGYKLDNSSNFEVKQYIKTGSTSADFIFNDILKRQEASLDDCKNKTTINYFDGSKINDIQGYKSDKNLNVNNCKWVAYKQKFFTTGVCFNNNINCELSIKNIKDGLSECNLNTKLDNLNENEIRYFFGPNDPRKMKVFADSFEKNVYLGFFLVSPFNKYVISPICGYLGSRVYSIILIVLLVLFLKILLLPVAYKIYITTLKMQLVNKIVNILRSRSGKNPQELAMQQIFLYKEFGINPLTMLLYSILQFPFIIALYNYIPIELSFRNSSFLWCKDLSSYDSILNLGFNIPMYGSHVSLSAILLGITMLIYLMLNNTQMEQSNNKLGAFQIFFMIFMIVISNRFCCALNFYYLFFNIVTFLIQFVLNKVVDITEFKNRVDRKIEQLR